MWERGCFPATILEQLRRPCRPRHPYAVPRTSLQCVCTRRRNCIAQLSPSREYALWTVDFPAGNSATIEPTQYPHGSGSRRRITLRKLVPVPISFFAPKFGHCSMRLALRICAIFGLTSKAYLYSIISSAMESTPGDTSMNSSSRHVSTTVSTTVRDV